MLKFCNICCEKKQTIVYKIQNPLFKIVSIDVCNECRNNVSELTDEEFRISLEEEYCNNFKIK